MPIKVVCPGCTKTLKAPDAMAGKQARCPHCKTQVVITAPRPDDAAYKLLDVPPPVRPLPESPVIAKSGPPETKPEPAARAHPAKSHPALADLKVKQASSARFWLFSLTLVPLVFSLLVSQEDTKDRFERTFAAHPELVDRLGQFSGEKSELFAILPDGRIDGAHLAYGSWMHWVYAMAAAFLFALLIAILFEDGRAELLQLLVIGLITATVGILLLLGFQWVAGWSQGVWIRGRGIVVVLFYLVKLIGFSYRAALDPSNGFVLSFLGFTFGVGLCEEFTKAAPVFVKLGQGDDVPWRKACVWGLASGVGFGIAEGIMYSSDYYNGLATFGIYPVRFISCVALHAIWTAAVALMVWHNRDLVGGDLDWGDWLLALLKVQGVPMLLHGLYDTLLKREMNALALATAVASFGWLAFLIYRSRATDAPPRRKRALVTA